MPKYILLTGASGFIGQHFLPLLKNFANDNAYELIILGSNPISGLKFVNSNGYTFTKNIFLESRIDTIEIVIHLGAFTPKSQAEANNIEGAVSNVNNTIHLMKQLPTIPKKIIFTSTLDIYPICDVPIIETMTPNPISLYGHSKLFCEKLVEQYAQENNVTCQILRLGHVYGPGEETYVKLIPITIQKILRNENPVLFGDGRDLRSFIHVTDTCNMILNSLKIPKYVGPINIASSHHISIADLINLIIKLSCKKIDVIKNRTSNVSRNIIFNSDKMHHFLGIESIEFEQGISIEYDYFLQLFKNSISEN